MLKRQKENRLKGFRNFLREEEGMGTVEIILIIVVLIGLVIFLKRSCGLWWRRCLRRSPRTAIR